mmetsp:Transcript_22986/g.38476  ORF Transcript_22986/g.38476 Transcript_22986/m.38476 type:complete len:543 (-) Transcript_22986:1096-2724(-)
MDKLFIFCFKSCLKGESDREFYDILEIDNPNLATPELIKKQFKRLSLSLHPDKLAQKGVEITAEHKQKFLKVKEAYDVLSDPKRKKLYDQLGLTGLKLMENPTEVDPMVILKNYQKNRKDRMLVVLLVAFVFAAVLILPILFSLKSDGTLGGNASWVAIWTPMWIVDVVMVMGATMVLCDGSEPEQNTGDDEDEEPPEEKLPLMERAYNWFQTAVFVWLQVFVLLKLDNTMWKRTWFEIFIPWFVYESLVIGNNVRAAVSSVPKPQHEDIASLLEEGQNGEEEVFMMKIELESKYFDKVLERNDACKAIMSSLLRVWLAIFLALKAEGSVQWNYGLVLLPIWVYFFMQYLLVFVYRSWGSSKLEGLDMEAIEAGEEKDALKVVSAQQGSHLVSTSMLLCALQCAPLFMAVLLISRLESSANISTFVIILPVFLVIGCCCCGVFCGICMLSNVDMEEFEGELKRQGGGMAGGGADGEEDGSYAPPAEANSSADANSEEGLVTGGGGSTKAPFQKQLEIEQQRQKDEQQTAPVASSADIEVDID